MDTPPKEIRLRKFEIARVSQTPARTILNWTRTGLLRPEIKAEGKGKTSYYTLANAVEARIFKLLSQRGLNLKLFKSLSSVLPKEKLEYLDPFQENADHQLFLVVKEGFETAEITLAAKKNAFNPNSAKNYRFLGQTVDLKELGWALSPIEENFNFLTVVNLSKVKNEVRRELEKLGFSAGTEKGS